MQSVEISAKTREEAIRTALRQLGVERHEVAVEILDEGSRGFLGLGAREVRVRVTAEHLPDIAARNAPEPAAETDRRTRSDRSERSESSERSERSEGSSRDDRDRGDRRERGGRRGGRGRSSGSAGDDAQRDAKTEGANAQKAEKTESRRPDDRNKDDQDRSERRSRGRRGGRRSSQRSRDDRQNETQPQASNREEGDRRQDSGEGRSRSSRGRRSESSRNRDDRNRAPQDRDQRQGRDDEAFDHLRSRSDRDEDAGAASEGNGAAEAPAAPRMTEAEIAAAASLLSEMITKSGMEATVSHKVSDEGEVTLTVESPDSALLIGRKGRNLEAMQYLLNRMIHAAEPGETPERVVIDIEGYLDRRRAGLEEMAHRLAEKARDTGRRVRVKPLSPQERRIIHLALENDPDVRTFSVGAAPSRCVVIAPKNERERPERSERSRRGGRDGGRRNGGRSRRGSGERSGERAPEDGDRSDEAAAHADDAPHADEAARSDEVSSDAAQSQQQPQPQADAGDDRDA